MCSGALDTRQLSYPSIIVCDITCVAYNHHTNLASCQPSAHAKMVLQDNTVVGVLLSEVVNLYNNGQHSQTPFSQPSSQPSSQPKGQQRPSQPSGQPSGLQTDRQTDRQTRQTDRQTDRGLLLGDAAGL